MVGFFYLLKDGRDLLHDCTYLSYWDFISKLLLEFVRLQPYTTHNKRRLECQSHASAELARETAASWQLEGRL